MVTDLPTTINGTRSRDDHIADHARLHLNLQQSVYSADYASLQLAIDDAISKNRPLTIAPGTQNIAAPLQVYGADRLSIINLGVINPTVSMDKVFDVVGCANFSLSGGAIQIPAGVVVQDAIHIYNDTEITASLTKRPYVGHIRISSSAGYFVNGLRIGDGDNSQCDHGLFERLNIGGSVSNSQRGVYLHGGWGNNLSHTVFACFVSNCDTGYEVAAINDVTLIECCYDGPSETGSPYANSVAYKIVSLSSNIFGGRVESSDKLYLDNFSTNVSSHRTLRGVLFAANGMVGNNWIEVANGGVFDLQVTCTNAPIEPHIKVNTLGQLWMSGSVLITAPVEIRPSAANLVDGANARGSLTYIQNDTGPSFVSGEVVTLT